MKRESGAYHDKLMWMRLSFWSWCHLSDSISMHASRPSALTLPRFFKRQDNTLSLTTHTSRDIPHATFPPPLLFSSVCTSNATPCAPSLRNRVAGCCNCKTNAHRVCRLATLTSPDSKKSAYALCSPYTTPLSTHPHHAFHSTSPFELQGPLIESSGHS